MQCYNRQAAIDDLPPTRGIRIPVVQPANASRLMPWVLNVFWAQSLALWGPERRQRGGWGTADSLIETQSQFLPLDQARTRHWHLAAVKAHNPVLQLARMRPGHQ